LIALALYLAFGAVRALMAEAHPETSLVSLGLLLGSVVVLPPLAVAKYRVAARLGSGAQRADSILSASCQRFSRSRRPVGNAITRRLVAWGLGTIGGTRSRRSSCRPAGSVGERR